MTILTFLPVRRLSISGGIALDRVRYCRTLVAIIEQEGVFVKSQSLVQPQREPREPPGTGLPESQDAKRLHGSGFLFLFHAVPWQQTGRPAPVPTTRARRTLLWYNLLACAGCGSPHR